MKTWCFVVIVNILIFGCFGKQPPHIIFIVADDLGKCFIVYKSFIKRFNNEG
jgi:hypothetical protein